MYPTQIIEAYTLETDQRVKSVLAEKLINYFICNPKSDKWDLQFNNMTEKEKWVPLDGFDNRYEISNYGRLKRMETVKGITKFGKRIIVKEKISSFYSKSGNYPHTNLTKEGRVVKILIHVEVAKAFVPNPDNKPFVNHIDGHKDNFIWSNLEWATIKENNFHAKGIGLNKNNGSDNINSILSDKEVMDIFNSRLKYIELSNIYKVSPGTISGIKRGKSWVHLTGKQFNAKRITPEKALGIFQSTKSYKDICVEFGVDIGMVNSIKAGASWGRVTGKYAKYLLKSVI